MSRNDHIFSSEITGTFYICNDRFELNTCNDCRKISTSTRSSSFTGMIVIYVLLSANDRALALIESISSTVRVCDIDG